MTARAAEQSSARAVVDAYESTRVALTLDGDEDSERSRVELARVGSNNSCRLSTSCGAICEASRYINVVTHVARHGSSTSPQGCGGPAWTSS